MFTIYFDVLTGCKVRYYPNYYIINDSRQFYDSNVPTYIQIEDHAYVEADLCELFTLYMLFGWISSQNCSNILNASIKRQFTPEDMGGKHPEEYFISSEQVFRAFALNGLLRDSAERGDSFILPNLGDNDDRLKCAMEVRSRRIISEGQVERMHACSTCEKFLPGDGYKNLRALLFCPWHFAGSLLCRFFSCCCYRWDHIGQTMLQSPQLHTTTTKQSGSFLH